MSENKQVYILSLEASDIYSHMYRDTNINYDYNGMIPFSLELLKLRKEGLDVKEIKNKDKEITNDIINVKFKQRLKSGDELKQIIEENKQLSDNEDYIKKLDDFLHTIEQNKDNDKWKQTSVSELRRILYTEGFTIKKYNKKTEETTITEYVMYKRSSAKSRTGQCLFIKKSLYEKMISWSQMNLPIKLNIDIDLAGLLAYQSLVGSSLEDTIEINPRNILMVSDIESKFKHTANIVKKGKSNYLDSIRDETEIVNSLFDGESLLDERFFTNGQSMILLRNHMFKSAAFNCRIQTFLKDKCPDDVIYDEWELEDMFGNEIKAKNIALICTPSSLKSFKFSNLIGKDEDMWEYWIKKIEEDGNLFGICKHDKKSKLGTDKYGNILQQTSYQMINCLPMKDEDIEPLIEVEKQYIDMLKNDDEFFIEKLKETSNIINSHSMLVDLYSKNNKMINTQLFRDFRKGFIKNHVSHTRKGKVKLVGDYCVMLGNPLEFLYHAIGKFDIHNVQERSLKNNEVHTTLFDYDKEYVGFRNPNTSPSNVLIVKNKKVDEIEKYFVLSDNIVCVNAINFPLQDILSGCDYDSDTVLLFNNEKLLGLAKKCFGKYPVCVNHVESQKKTYSYNKYDMFLIDDQLSSSQRNIGKVVNLGQFCMSTYWDLKNKGEYGDHVEELLKKVDVMTILSGISIDMAKKFYEIDIDKEIKNVQKNDTLKTRKKKPNFWQYVSQSKTIKNRITSYNCPMDYLIEELKNIKAATRKDNLPFENFLIENDTEKINYKQLEKVILIVKDLDGFVKNENAKSIDKEERQVNLENLMNDYIDRIKKLKINEFTMCMIVKIVSETESKLILRLLNVLYNAHKDNFLKLFI